MYLLSIIILELTAKPQDKLAELKEELLKKTAARIIYRIVDVGDFESVEASVSSSVKEMGDIDILINNVCIFLPFLQRVLELQH